MKHLYKQFNFSNLVYFDAPGHLEESESSVKPNTRVENLSQVSQGEQILEKALKPSSLNERIKRSSAERKFRRANVAYENSFNSTDELQGYFLMRDELDTYLGESNSPEVVKFLFRYINQPAYLRRFVNYLAEDGAFITVTEDYTRSMRSTLRQFEEQLRSRLSVARESYSRGDLKALDSVVGYEMVANLVNKKLKETNRRYSAALQRLEPEKKE